MVKEGLLLHLSLLTQYLCRIRGKSRKDIILHVKAWEIQHRKIQEQLVSQIQDRIKTANLTRTKTMASMHEFYNRLPNIKDSASAMVEFKSHNDDLVDYIIELEGIIKENVALLEGSPSNLSKAEIEDVEKSYKQIQKGKSFKTDNVEEAIAELKEGSACDSEGKKQ